MLLKDEIMAIFEQHFLSADTVEEHAELIDTVTEVTINMYSSLIVTMIKRSNDPETMKKLVSSHVSRELMFASHMVYTVIEDYKKKVQLN